MIETKTPNGIPVKVPEIDIEDVSKKFLPNELNDAKEYYEKNGYVIFRNLFERQLCQEIRDLWNKEVKKFSGFMYRQATARSEKHIYSPEGWVMNPILNLQSICPKNFALLRSKAVGEILCSNQFKAVFSSLLGEPPKIVQSMYFEGNSATWEHQDTYYLDSEIIGSMSAAWVALEDIGANSGRFFVCPGSHLIRLENQTSRTNIADNHHVYISEIVNLIKERRMEIRAPKLDTGDVLFWHSRTIHGSLRSTEGCGSRSSITAHAIPKTHRFLQLQSRVVDVPVETINGVEIWRPKDQAEILSRFVKLIESYLPTPFYALKRVIVKSLIARRNPL